MSKTVNRPFRADPYWLIKYRLRRTLEDEQMKCKELGFCEGCVDVESVDNDNVYEAIRYFQISKQWEDFESFDINPIVDSFFLEMFPNGDVNLGVDEFNQVVQYLIERFNKEFPHRECIDFLRKGISGIFDMLAFKWYPCDFGGHSEALAQVFGCTSAFNMACKISDGELNMKEVNDRIKALVVCGEFYGGDTVEGVMRRYVLSELNQSNY